MLAMSQAAPTHASWNISRSGTACQACGAALDPGKGCWAALVEGFVAAPPAEAADAQPKPAEQAPAKTAVPYSRLDYCEACWAAGKRPEAPATMFCFWKTTVPVPQQKKKLLVDDSVLVEVFTRLAGRESMTDIRFRFVLALILMRKRLLKYEGIKQPAEAGENPKPELWAMQPRGGGEPVEVINPQLTTDQIVEVSQQLSGILAEEI
jgi:hypothetical protein